MSIFAIAVVSLLGSVLALSETSRARRHGVAMLWIALIMATSAAP